MRRETVDGKPWAPSKNARVCSRHFVDGTPRDPDSPGYMPRLYLKPTSSDQNEPKRETAEATRYKRRKLRLVFSSLGNNGEAEVQTNLPAPRENKQTMTDTCYEADCSVNVDSLSINNLFCGYKSVQEKDFHLLEIAGVKLGVFSVLLSLVPAINQNCFLGRENKLLLFLMKLKLGISFAALGIF